MKQLHFILLLVVAIPTTAHAVSFDCNKASTLVEHTICSNAELSSSDDQLATRYKGAMETANNKETLKADQRKWLTIRNNCKDIECLKKAYANRISYLDKYINVVDKDGQMRDRGQPSTVGNRVPSTPGPTPTANDIETLIKQGNLGGARTAIEQVIREKPDSAKAYYLYAQILHAQKQDTQARQALLKSEQLNPATDFANPSYLAKLKAELNLPVPTAQTAKANNPNPDSRKGVELTVTLTFLLLWVLGGVVTIVILTRRSKRQELSQSSNNWQPTKNFIKSSLLVCLWTGGLAQGFCVLVLFNTEDSPLNNSTIANTPGGQAALILFLGVLPSLLCLVYFLRRYVDKYWDLMGETTKSLVVLLCVPVFGVVIWFLLQIAYYVIVGILVVVFLIFFVRGGGITGPLPTREEIELNSIAQKLDDIKKKL